MLLPIAVEQMQALGDIGVETQWLTSCNIEMCPRESLPYDFTLKSIQLESARPHLLTP